MIPAFKTRNISPETEALVGAVMLEQESKHHTRVMPKTNYSQGMNGHTLEKSQRVVDALKAGSMTVRQIALHLGVSQNSVRDYVRPLVNGGIVEKVNAKSPAVRYQLAGQDAPALFVVPASKPRPQGGPSNTKRVLANLRGGPQPARELALLTGLTVKQVSAVMRGLRQRGLARQVMHGHWATAQQQIAAE